MVGMNSLTGAALGAIVGLGALITIAGFCGVTSPSRPTRSFHIPPDLGLRLCLGLIGFITGLALTGWPVLAGLVAALGVSLPSLVGAKARREAEVSKLEAIASWTESLQGLLASAAGLQQAIVRSERVAPEPLRDALAHLVARLEHDPFGVAMRRFAAEVAHPAADLVVMAIVQAHDHHARSLGEVLSSAARSTRSMASMYMRIEASRARLHTSVRMIVTTTLVFAGALIVFNRSYLEPFASFSGQVMLVVIGALFGTALWMLNRMAQVTPPPRFFASVAHEVLP